MRDSRGVPGSCASEPHSRAVLEEIQAELESHLELAAEAAEAAGEDPERAREQALERLGDMEAIQASCIRVRLGGEIFMRTVVNVGFALLLVLCGVLWMQTRNLSLLAAEENELRQQTQAQLEELLSQERVLASSGLAGLVQPGDVIELFDRHRVRDFGGRHRVQGDGKVLLMDLGWHAVSGYSREELGAHLTELYAPFYEGLTIDVAIHRGD